MPRSTGEAIDYVYGEGDTRWSYSAELRDTGTVSGSCEFVMDSS